MRVINIASDGKVVDDLSSDVRFPLVVLRRPAEDKIEVFVAEDPIAMARSVEAGERATKRRLLVACPFALVALALVATLLRSWVVGVAMCLILAVLANKALVSADRGLALMKQDAADAADGLADLLDWLNGDSDEA